MRTAHFLVPTDFSETALHALSYALEEARLHQAKLTLLHVLPPHSVTDVYYASPEPPRSTSDPRLDELLGSHGPSEPTVVRSDPGQGALTRLGDLMPETFRGMWDAEVVRGQPADAIVRFAQERDIDLIVMGTHGRSGLQHVFLGSVAEKVVRQAPCPVLTVRYKRRAAAP
jgi:nucleotide-binding universal stress UspA family protein